ncbi:MAG: cupredoxin family copper-binding protein, partial [Pirellulales bacterium]
MRQTSVARLRLPLTFIVVALILAVASAGCSPMGGASHGRGMHGGGEDTRSDQQVRGAADTAVEILDFAFSPGNLQVTAGTSVTWVNRDSVLHTATAVDQSWDTGLLAQDESFTIRFDTPGVYDYSCVPHPDMKARVEVV